MNSPSSFDTANTKFRILKISGGNYLVAIANGEIDTDGLARLFRTVAQLWPSLPDCRVLIDLEAAKVKLEPPAIDLILAALQPELPGHKICIAVVTSAQTDISNRLCLLKKSLCKAGFRVAVFDDTKDAVAWLSQRL